MTNPANSTFPNLTVPLSDFENVFASFFEGRANPFQGAHLIADALFENDDLRIVFDMLGINSDVATNGVLSPDSGRAGALLGVWTHRGGHVRAFNELLFNTGTGGDQFLNTFANNVLTELRMTIDDAGARAATITRFPSFH